MITLPFWQIFTWRIFTLSIIAIGFVACSTSDQQNGNNEPTRPPPEDSAFFSPQGIAANDHWIVVANSGFYFEDGESSWSRGFVTIIERSTRNVVRRIFTTQQNPRDIVIDHNVAYVLNSGTTQIDDEGVVYSVSNGGIDIITLTPSVANLPTEVTNNIPLGLEQDPRIGDYGTLAIVDDGRIAYVGSGTRGDLFKINLQSGSVMRGPENPIVLFPTPEGSNGLTIVKALPNKGGLAVLNFNEDALCISSTTNIQSASQFSCHSVGVNSELLEGPIDLLPLAENEFLVLMTIANSVYHVHLGDSTEIDHRWAQTGLANNQLLRRGDTIYVVNSLSNNLQRIDLQSRESELPWAILPVRSNPYQMTITRETEGNMAWVTLFAAHQLALVNADSGELIDTIGGTIDPVPTPDGGTGGDDDGGENPPEACTNPPTELVTIANVVNFSVGSGGGFHQDQLPGVIQDGPTGFGESGGAIDGVLSLGDEGEIIVDFGSYDIIDGPGPDFIVFENPFLVSPYKPYAEPAFVSVSATSTMPDDFLTFPCDPTQTNGDPTTQTWPYPGCAGVHPVFANVNENEIDPADPNTAGGDAYDLADLGLSRARYVRIRDAGTSSIGTITQGFDLDAVVVVHACAR